MNNTLINYATKDYVVEAVANVSSGGSVDLNNYATKTYVDNAILVNKPDMSSYATQTYVDSKTLAGTVDIGAGTALTTGVVYYVYE